MLPVKISYVINALATKHTTSINIYESLSYERNDRVIMLANAKRAESVCTYTRVTSRPISVTSNTMRRQYIDVILQFLREICCTLPINA